MAGGKGESPSTPAPNDRVKSEDGASSAQLGSASPEKPKERKRRLDVNPSLIISGEGRSKRRRTPSPAPVQVRSDPDPRNPERAKALGLQIYNKIMAMKDSDGDSMAEPFVKLPNKRQFPDYYETIKHPMALDMVKQRLDAGEYQMLKDVIHDLGQIWNNAKRYNVRDSLLFQWAKKMHKVTRTFYNHHTSQDDDSDSDAEEPLHAPATPSQDRRGSTAEIASPGSGTAGPSTPAGDTPLNPRVGRKRGSYMKDGPTVYKLIKPCMKAIEQAKADDGSGRDIADIFQSLPDRKSFPDYYKTIKNPISLADIEQRMVARKYDTSEHFFAEIEVMCDNAMMYNEDNSEVWRDARQIREIVQMHRGLVKERLALGPKAATSLPVSAGKMKASAVAPVRMGHNNAMPGVSPHAVHGMAQHPAFQTPDPRTVGYAQSAYGGYAPSPSKHVVPPQQQPPPPPQQQQQPHGVRQPPASAGSVTYLAQLPQGVVSEDIVASLERYPAFEQQMWINSLPPLAHAIYRQMVATNEARKRGAAPPPPTPGGMLAELPPTSQHGQTQEQKPKAPTIEHIDLGYSGGHNRGQGSGNAIRLHNLTGVLAHAVLIGADTVELELTARLSPDAMVPPRKASAASDISGTQGGESAGSQPASEALPDISLRINGNAGPQPRLIYSGVTEDRPTALRWTLPAPPSRIEFKIEVVVSKPGPTTETSAIFINRQY